jgi:hypothetical protein
MITTMLLMKSSSQKLHRLTTLTWFKKMLNFQGLSSLLKVLTQLWLKATLIQDLTSYTKEPLRAK